METIKSVIDKCRFHIRRVVRCFKQLLYIPCPHKGCHGHLSQYGWHDKTDGTMIYQCNICKNKFV